MASTLIFARVFSSIEPKDFQHYLDSWRRQFFQLLRFDTIHVDEKSLCGSVKKAKTKKRPIFVNAYLPKAQVILEVVRVPNKSNEIKAP